jgi:hypothetical protein
MLNSEFLILIRADYVGTAKHGGLEQQQSNASGDVRKHLDHRNRYAADTASAEVHFLRFRSAGDPEVSINYCDIGTCKKSTKALL